MKKRPGWCVSFTPEAPTPPRKPTEKITRVNRIEIFSSTIDELPLADIPLPENITWNDVIIGTENEYGGCTKINVFYITESIITNVHYVPEMQRYEKEIERYNKEKAAYKQEIKDWKLWVKQEKQRALNNQIEAAKELLKKYGPIGRKNKS